MVFLGIGVLLGWLAMTFLRDPAKAMVIFAGLLIAPVFLRSDGKSIHLGDALYPHNPGQTFPAGLLALALLLALSFLKTVAGASRWRTPPLAGLVIALIIVNLVVLLIGQLESPQLQLWSVAFFFQTVAPMFCFFLAVNYVRSIKTVRAVVITCGTVMGGFVLALIAASLMRNGVAGTVRDGLYWIVFFLPIYTTFDYFPLLVTVAYGLGLALLLGGTHVRGGSLLAVGVAGMLASVFLLHSRGALLTLGAVTIVQLALFGIYAPSRRRALVAAAACAAVVAVPFLAGRDSLTIAYFRSPEFRLAREYSLEARMDRFSVFSAEILDYPLTGSAYLPGYELQGIAHLGNPHDQYLTYAVRGGVVSLFLFLFILFVAHRQLILTWRRAQDPLENSLATGLLSVLLSVSLVSNPLQDNFTQSYSGLLLWFLIGVGQALYALSRRDSGGGYPRGLAGPKPGPPR